MRFARRYKAYLIYILAMLAALLFFGIFKGNRSVMHILAALSRVFHAVSVNICAVLPFSVAELMYTSVLVLIVSAIGVTAVKVVKYGKKRISSAVRLTLTLASVGLTVCVGLSVLWGVNYYVAPFEEKSGLASKPVSAEQLHKTTAFFVTKLRDTCDKLERGPDLVCEESIMDAVRKSKTIYRPLEQEYPFLKGRENTAKPMAYSRLFSALGFTGYFFPFTGESNINIDTPPAFIPSTIAHEIAHVRGVAPEQTANFVAVRACEESGDAFYEYSGWLLGYVHLSSALYSADKAAYFEVSKTLPPQVRADLRADSQYWQQFESPVQEVANTAYSEFLKGYDQELGSKSYGACVDLLCAYYG